MLWIKSFHLVAMVAWFAGLFYLPRLFVYHADATDMISVERFKIMERRLFWAIMTPAALITVVLGVTLLTYNWAYYMRAGWMHMKLTLVALLLGYHIVCGYYQRQFKQDTNVRTSKFFRLFNEVPTLFLIAIVVLVVVRPF